MPRINKEITNTIVAGVLKAGRFQAQLEAVKTEWKKAMKIELLRQIDAFAPGFFEKTAELPKGWFRHLVDADLYSSYTARNCGCSDEASSIIVHADLDDPIHHPQLFRRNENDIYPVAKPFAQRLDKIIAKRDKANATARQLIGQYRTTEALAKDAPELVKFMPALSAGGMLPAITVSNALADLMQQGVDFKEEVAA